MRWNLVHDVTSQEHNNNAIMLANTAIQGPLIIAGRSADLDKWGRCIWLRSELDLILLFVHLRTWKMLLKIFVFCSAFHCRLNWTLTVQSKQSNIKDCQRTEGIFLRVFLSLEKRLFLLKSVLDFAAGLSCRKCAELRRVTKLFIFLTQLSRFRLQKTQNYQFYLTFLPITWIKPRAAITKQSKCMNHMTRDIIHSDARARIDWGGFRKVTLSHIVRTTIQVLWRVEFTLLIYCVRTQYA